MIRSISAAIVLVFALSLASSHATEYVWTGAKDANWNTPANWRPNSGVPGKDDHVAIAGLKGNATITLAGDTAVRSLTFDPGALHACTIEKNTLVLVDGARIVFAKLPGDVGMGKTASQTIAGGLRISGRVTLANMNRAYLGGERIRIEAPIDGDGTIVVGGVAGGIVQLFGDNSRYTGQFVIETGNLMVSHPAALGSGNDPVRMHGGTFTIGARISTARDFLVLADAAWDSHGPNGSHDGTVTVDRGATWTVKNGGGNTMTLTGVVQGEGNLAFTAHGTTIAGPKTNTLSGTVTFGGIRGQTILAKPNGVTAVAGPVVMSNVGTLRWNADDQIADHVPVAFAGKLPTLSLDGHHETLGPLDLQSDGRIDLGETAGRLVFADSSARAWDLEKVLLVVNGGKERGTIRFGNRSNGLTPRQLQRVGFVDPAGYAPGTYTARLTPSGELVPSGQLVQPVNLPIDTSDGARARRRALYEVPGMDRLSGSQTPLKPGMTISVFGDSITWGDGYLRRIRAALRGGEGSKSLGVKVVNHGVNGGGVLAIRDGDDSTNHFGKTRPRPFAAAIAADDADVAVVYIGVNDVWWRKTTPEVFEQALRDLVGQAETGDTTLVLATLAIMKETVGRRDPKCDAFADITRKVARESGTTLVDLRAAFMACLDNESVVVRPGGSWTSDAKLLTHDGVHPTARGEAVLADLIAQGIFEALQR